MRYSFLLLILVVFAALIADKSIHAYQSDTVRQIEQFDENNVPEIRDEWGDQRRALIDFSDEEKKNNNSEQGQGLEEHLIDDDKYSKQVAPKPRTATGGVINTLMIFLTILAFVGNAAFLVHVFWLKENITFQQEPPKALLPFNNFGLGPT